VKSRFFNNKLVDCPSLRWHPVTALKFDEQPSTLCFGQEELWVVFRVGKSHKARPLAVERRLEEMPSSLYGTGLPICSIQFWFLQANNSLAGGCCL
jgi:hypothetical protein